MITNQWTKSTASMAANCVEVIWKKSSASISNATCVEVGMKKKGESDRA